MRYTQLRFVIVLLAVSGLMLAACRRGEVTPTPIALATSTATPLAPTASPPPSPTAPPTPLPTVTPAPPTPDTTESLAQAVIPVRDLEELALRFKSISRSGQAAPITTRHDFQLGDRETFWVTDNGSGTPNQLEISTRLAYVTDHAYWWVQEGYNIPDVDLIVSAEKFESQTYPTNRTYFGSEWSPGIDADPRLHVVMGRVPGVAGYYTSSNEYSRFANEYSNEREMFLINLDTTQPGTDYFDSILAHEFQHMIHWNEDPDEDTWLNEGLSELARYINGFGLSAFIPFYLDQPDLQLTAWGADAASRNAHYGYGFLFTAYLFDKYGGQAVRRIVAQPENGAIGIEKALAETGVAVTFDSIFANFVIANYLNDAALDQGQWGYAAPDFDLPAPTFSARHQNFPIEVSDTVHQYGVDYIEVDTEAENLTLTFRGNMTATLIDTLPRSGRYFWYSNRGDSADTRLTRRFDLSGLSSATLKFWAWYDIESSWDNGYIAVLVDGGQTWQALPATTTSTANPVGAAYGPAFTGQSNGWVEQTVNLSAFAGQIIQLRFEYITDDAVNSPGFAIDDIRLPELNYNDDVETLDQDWLAEGFIRTDNLLPQRFVVQIIEFDTAGRPSVQRLSLDQTNQATYQLTASAGQRLKAGLVFSALAPVTSALAQYSYSLTQ